MLLVLLFGQKRPQKGTCLFLGGLVTVTVTKNERISKKLDFWIFTLTVTVTVTASDSLDLSEVPWRWRAASSVPGISMSVRPRPPTKKHVPF